MGDEREKSRFAAQLKTFASTLAGQISEENEWTIRGFIDIFKNVYVVSSDTKIISKLLELHLFPKFLSFAESIGYEIELATHQNWYPDLTFIKREDPNIKGFAMALRWVHTVSTLSIGPVERIFSIPIRSTTDIFAWGSYIPGQRSINWRRRRFIR